MKLKKLIVATAASEARTIAEPRMNRAPASRPPCSGPDFGGSAVRIRLRNQADPRNDSASAATANGAVSHCTSTPPTLGPPTNDSARLP